MNMSACFWRVLYSVYGGGICVVSAVLMSPEEEYVEQIEWVFLLIESIDTKCIAFTELSVCTLLES